MARTVITPQTINLKGGAVITFAAIDQANGMQVLHAGRHIVLVQAIAASSVNVTIPSVACGHGRVGDITTVAVSASTIKAFGPFSPVELWGDGLSNLFINFAGSSGTVTIAVVEIGV